MAQVEASGDVGTLFLLLESMGIRGWRDMNEDDLTEAAMRQGVYDSEVFVFFLTNSALSRIFCQKELGWAIAFQKRIIVVVEREGRFWAWDLERWQQDLCARDNSTWPHTWQKPNWLQTWYRDVPQPIRALIETAAAENEMLPFRRRDYEVNALAREIVRRARSDAWGPQMPPETKAAVAGAARVVLFVRGDDARAVAIQAELRSFYAQASPGLRWYDATTAGVVGPSHVLVLLTRSVLRAESRSAAALERVVQSYKASQIVYAYVEPVAGEEEGWDFSAFYAQKPGYAASLAVKTSIQASAARSQEPVSE